MQPLMNRFKEFRRTSVPRSSSSTPLSNTKKPPKQRSPGIIQQAASRRFAISLGEDSVSLERHENCLMDELRKRKPNEVVVSDLVKRTFSLRRKTILDTPMSMDLIFIKYPFFKDINHVSTCIVILFL